MHETTKTNEFCIKFLPLILKVEVKGDRIIAGKSRQPKFYLLRRHEAAAKQPRYSVSRQPAAAIYRWKMVREATK